MIEKAVRNYPGVQAMEELKFQNLSSSLFGVDAVYKV